jgi:hypothetical protein
VHDAYAVGRVAAHAQFASRDLRVGDRQPGPADQAMLQPHGDPREGVIGELVQSGGAHAEHGRRA